MGEFKYIDGDPKPLKEGNLKSIDDFEVGEYYWARYNTGFFIVQCWFGKEPCADQTTWVLTSDLCKHPLSEALTVFAGGIYGPLEKPYDT